MWHSMLPAVDVVLKAALGEDKWIELVLSGFEPSD